MADKSDPQIAALDAVYRALKPLDSEDRKRVLASVFALLGIEKDAELKTNATNEPNNTGTVTAFRQSTARPTSLIETIDEKHPATNAQRIAVFAYHREKYEGQSRFSRGDLKSYFPKAKLPPAGNFDRDFTEAVRRGWIHEDESDSYLTTRGIEAVESGFEGERQSPKKASKQKPRKATNKRRLKR